MLWLESMHLLWKKLRRYSRDKDNNMIVSDLIPAFTISDPTTYVNLPTYGEYSGVPDVQFMHPSYEPYYGGNLEEVFWELCMQHRESRLWLLTTTF
jgi:hypothetical protein